HLAQVRQLLGGQMPGGLGEAAMAAAAPPPAPKPAIAAEPTAPRNGNSGAPTQVHSGAPTQVQPAQASAAAHQATQMSPAPSQAQPRATNGSQATAQAT